MGGWIGRTTQYTLPLLLMILAVALYIMDPLGLIDRARKTVFDLYQDLQPRAYQDVLAASGHTLPGVRIIDLDDESLERIGQWPWPRTKVADLVVRLIESGALVVAFDMVFAEPDGTSPETLRDDWSTIPDYKPISQAITQIDNLPRHDDLLARILGHPQVNVVTGFVLSLGEIPRKPVKKSGEAFGGDNPRLFIRPRYPGAVANLTVLEEAAKGNGSFNVVPDADGTVRRAPMMVALSTSDDIEDIEDITLYPSLSLETLRVLQGARTIVIRSSGASGIDALGAQTGVSDIKVGTFTIPTNPAGEMWVHYTDPVPERYVPAYRLFEEDFDPTPIANHIVLIGTSAAGLKDIRRLPLNPTAPGVVVHANVLEQVLLGRFLGRPDYAPAIELFYMVILCAIMIVMVPQVGAVYGAVSGAVAVTGAIGFCWYMYSVERILVDPIYPSLAAFGIYLVSSFVKYVREQREKETIRGAFSMYLSPDLVAQLADHPEQLVLGGEMRQMTLLFADIRGFTTISEQFQDPRDLTRFINRFLTPMTEIIMNRRGTIDKYMGDCIMAFWNAPLDDDQHALNACRSALEMCRGRDRLNGILEQEAETANRRFIPVNIGIGLNSDNVCVGNMGSDQRFDYSVLGDGVNLASRLEGQSKTYGVDIVIGPVTNAEAEAAGFATLELDLIQVKGKTVPVNIFALFGEEEEGGRESFRALKEAHNAMIAMYRSQQWTKALKLLAACRTFNDTRLAPLYAMYDDRIAEYRQHPPPEDWDGAYIATSK